MATAEFPAPPVTRAGYHHGGLRQALIEAGVELARTGGPDAVVLREVARRIGVSPNAAYRHFAAFSDLMDAVADAALGALAEAMEAEFASNRRPRRIDKRAAALAELMAAGRAYVHFALAEPGLFAMAFSQHGGDEEAKAQASPHGRSAFQLLLDALDGLVAADLLAPEDRDAAATTAWSTVHGLSTLLLGPLADWPADEREPLIESTLGQICRGLLRR